MLHGVTAQMPPPSGPPQTPLTPTSEPTSGSPGGPPSPPYAGHPGQPDHPGQPGQPGIPASPYPPAGSARVSGLAIAALCCGLAAFIPLVGVVAVVLGVIAVHQLRGGFQRGRGLAITGIVLGALGSLAWAVAVALLIAAGVTGEPARDASGQVAPAQTVYFDDLHAGDCFDGVPAASDATFDQVTSRACTTPHEAQIATLVELPKGDFPGDDASADLADKACADAVEPLIRDDVVDIDLSFTYPDTALAWRLDRHAVCILEGSPGKLTGSALK